MSIQTAMRELLAEAEGADEMGMALPHLVNTMLALGMDPSDEDSQEHFLSILRMVVKNKSALKSAMKRHTGAKAMKAMKATKAAV